MTAVVVPPGAPTVDSAGPLFPTLDMKRIPCLLTASLITSQMRLKQTERQRKLNVQLVEY